VDIYPARLVLSKAGRDKNKYFSVLEVSDETYVLLCDGKARRLESPKKKKIKHIEDTGIELIRIKEKMNEGKKISNSDIRKAIKAAMVELGIEEDEELKEG